MKSEDLQKTINELFTKYSEGRITRMDRNLQIINLMNVDNVKQVKDMQKKSKTIMAHYQQQKEKSNDS